MNTEQTIEEIISSQAISTVFDDQLLFMDACDQKPSYQNMMLYASLTKEEAKETQDAAIAISDHWKNASEEDRQGMLAELIDGAIDTIYVASGILNSIGIDPMLFWNEVQQSNVAKIDPETGKVIKRADGKVLKPAGWTPPDIVTIVKENWPVIDATLS